MTLLLERPPLERYGGGMTARKFTISMPEELYAEVERLAREEGTSISAWITGVVDRQRRLAALGATIAKYEAEHGAFTPEEIAATAKEMAEAHARSYARAARMAENE